MMSPERRILELIAAYVEDNTEGPWTARRDRFLEEASQDEQTALVEFCSWFTD